MMEKNTPIEKLPEAFSFQNFLNVKVEEERLVDSKRSDYSKDDSLEHLYSSNQFKQILSWFPERASLIEKLFNPETKEEEFDGIFEKINQVNKDTKFPYGGYSGACLTSNSGKSICFELDENNKNLFFFENGKKPENLPY